MDESNDVPRNGLDLMTTVGKILFVRMQLDSEIEVYRVSGLIT